MEHPGKDPLRGKFTRFLQESIKHCKIDYLRKSEHRPISLEALCRSKRITIGKAPLPRGLIFNGKPWARPTAPCREATRKSFSFCW